jgi:TnpA family transposase
MMLCKSIETLIGYRLVASDVITKEVQARKHKKKRINKKWLKRYGLKTVPDYETILVVDGCIIAQPKTIERIIATVDKRYLDTIKT